MLDQLLNFGTPLERIGRHVEVQRVEKRSCPGNVFDNTQRFARRDVRVHLLARIGLCLPRLQGVLVQFEYLFAVEALDLHKRVL